ncbi:hypothetical protein [Lactobacillus agrestimuris]|uniref:hypothetical protein n=1 Tax=Lactobacillus agrestimuris TaxID=2941328 RepID=UPI0020446713|nr:hypothetical protein [Lactobacillus agrestimuris]
MKNEKKRRLKYTLATILTFLMTLIWVVFLILDITNVHNGNPIQDIIYVIVLLVVTMLEYFRLRDIGTPDDEDERDNYIDQRVNAKMYKISQWIILGLAAVLMCFAGFLYKQPGNHDFAFAVGLIAVTLGMLWNVFLLIEIIISVIVEHKS